MEQNVFKKIAEIKKKNLGNHLAQEAVLDLIERVTGRIQYREKFIIKKVEETKTGLDEYWMYDNNDKIVIEATSGVAAAVAFNYYLKEKCKCFFGPLTQNMNLPEIPPTVGEPVENHSVFLYRYFMNYVTYAYTCLYYQWKDYERLTDWMLLAGVNLVVNPVGYEIVWRDTLLELGYTKEEANADLCGAGNLPWQIMGNMSGFGGDIPDWWYEDQKDLSIRITDKLRAFGADVIRPGFAGKVPVNFKVKYPDSNVFEQGDWNYAGERPPLLDSDDVMFEKIAKIFYEKTRIHFGKTNYFGGDPFYEGGIIDKINLGKYAQKFVESMKLYSEGSVWFFQGWSGDPKQDVLNGLKKEEVMIGFLSADRFYTRSDLFGGYPWLYVSICNFGGNKRLMGAAAETLQEPFDALKSTKNDLVIGIGMSMEAIENDEIMYDILAVNSIRNKPLSMDKYLTQYFVGRYGYVNKNILDTFRLLVDEIYTLYEKRAFKSSKSSGLCTCPNLNVYKVGWFEAKGDSPYDITIVQTAVKNLLMEYDKLSKNECYRFDLMELCRQANADISWKYIKALKVSYRHGNKEKFEEYVHDFMHLFDVQEALLSTNEHTLLGTWLKRAKEYGKTETERRIFEYNAKNLLTLWCGKKGKYRLRDYAFREWSGMLSGYYKKRWDAYLTLLSLDFNRYKKVTKINWTEHDYVFSLSTEKYPDKASGDLKKAVENSVEMWGI